MVVSAIDVTQQKDVELELRALKGSLQRYGGLAKVLDCDDTEEVRCWRPGSCQVQVLNAQSESDGL